MLAYLAARSRAVWTCEVTVVPYARHRAAKTAAYLLEDRGLVRIVDARPRLGLAIELTAEGSQVATEIRDEFHDLAERGAALEREAWQ